MKPKCLGELAIKMVVITVLVVVLVETFRRMLSIMHSPLELGVLAILGFLALFALAELTRVWAKEIKECEEEEGDD
jgi:hypothetical protein